jgi:hypothetical protein
MSFENVLPETGEHKELFSNHPERSKDAWDFLQIEGANIANILFDPSQPLLNFDEGRAALDDALTKLRQEVARLADRMPAQHAPQSN